MVDNPVLKYSRERGGRAIAVMKLGSILDMEGQNGWNPAAPRDLESCTKSLCPLLANQLKADGLLASLDVLVCSVITEWAGASPQKRACTLRQLLCFISGLNGGATGSNPTYAQAIGALMPLGEVGLFEYGPNPVHVAAAFFNRIVRVAGFTDWVDYLRQRIAGPAGITFAPFDDVAPGEWHLAGGAHMNILNMAKLGELMRLTDFGDAFTPTGPFPAYRMNLWFMAASNINTLISGSMVGAVDLPNNGYCAAGAHNNRLFIAGPIVVARTGVDDATWNDVTFLDSVMQRYS